jgi:hypothetical protein
MGDAARRVPSRRTKIPARDLPTAICGEIDQFLMDFSTPLILDGVPAGSGTFIKCGTLHGILTAYHVVHNPKYKSRVFDFSAKSAQQLGLTVTNRRSHAFAIPMSYLSCVDIGKPRQKDSGPDLSVIILPEVRARDIAFRKSFTDISLKRRERMAKCDAADGGWCAIGFPQQYTRPHESSDATRRVTYIPSLTLYTGKPRKSDEFGFDFLRLNVTHSQMHGNVDPPLSYGGMSGGGVWKVRVRKDAKTSVWSLDVRGTILAGVIVCQRFVKNRPKSLQCHGWKSIYRRVYLALSKWESRR